MTEKYIITSVLLEITNVILIRSYYMKTKQKLYICTTGSANPT